MKNRKWIILLVSLAIFLTLCYLIFGRSMTITFYYRIKAGNLYTIGTIKTNNPLSIYMDSIHIINSKNYHFNPPVQFMADPFIVKEKNGYYIFFEQFSSKINTTWGDIAVLKSNDLINWEHLGIVLDEPFHLSYPNVFKFEDKWYMLPETGSVNEVRIYESKNFPYNWELSKRLIKNKAISDPIIIISNNFFYLLGYANTDGSLRLYYSDNIFGRWEEHPRSPIRIGWLKDTRPGGRPEIINGKLIYFVQDHTYGYGTGVIAYQIDSISPTYFKDTRLKDNPVLFRFGNGWAANGIHQLSWVMLPDSSYFCVVDGAKYYKRLWGWDWKNFPQFRIHFIKECKKL